MPKVLPFINRRAFLVIELLIAIGLFALVFTLIGGALVAGQQGESFSGSRSRALLLAAEGLEATRSISGNGWDNLIPGTFGLATSSGHWVLSGANDLIGSFTRQLTITDLDLRTKRVTSRVNWFSLPTKNESVTLTEDLTNWHVSWSATSTEQGALNISGGQNAVKVAVSGNYAYVIFKAVSQNFAVINIATPTSPAVVGTASLSNEPKNIAVRGNYVYIASKNNSQELQVVDISNPAAPTQVGAYNASGNEDGLGVAATGTVVLLGRDQGTPGFLIINVATPTNPTLLGSLTFAQDTRVNEVAVIGKYAYLSTDDDSGELKVIDISNLSAPTLVASLDLSGSSEATSIAGFGTTVVVGQQNGGVGLAIVNVATPTSPTLFATFPVNGNVNDVVLGRNGTHAFLATTQSDKELQVVNLVTPSLPALLSFFNTSGSLTGIDYQPIQDRIYVVGQDNSAEFMSFKPNQP